MTDGIFAAGKCKRNVKSVYAYTTFDLTGVMRSVADHGQVGMSW